MSFIENCSLEKVLYGRHRLPSTGSILIQITDPGLDHIIPYYDDYHEIYKFWIWDISKVTYEGNREFIPMGELDSKIIKRILLKALEQERNVIVHCHAGLCRSGAVTEFGHILGLIPVHSNRLPNVHMISMFKKTLYDLGG